MLWAHVTITAMRDDSGRLLGFAKLTRDLTERQRVEAIELAGAERELILDAERTARMTAQRATRVKDEFLATLSHELRTPLSAILGWTQVMLRTQPLGPAEHRRAIEVIDRNARAQVKLIDDLLDLSRIMTGKIRIDLQQVSMPEVVQAAIDSALPIAEAKDIRLNCVLDPTRMLVNGDASRLQQVAWNLLTNAIKFTPHGGRVDLLVQRLESRVELSVSDNGIGIAASFIPLVFDRFSQGDSSTTRSHGGLGLGLAICKQLVGSCTAARSVWPARAKARARPSSSSCRCPSSRSRTRSGRSNRASTGLMRR
jgi:signal transduction histidine kinase